MEWSYDRLSAFDDSRAKEVYRHLSSSRKQRIDRFKRADDRKRSLLGEYLVKELLKTVYGLESPTIECAENGRPFLRDSSLCISISHSGDIVACAVSDHPVGIDVERIQPIRKRLIERVCTAPEASYVWQNAVPDSDEVTDRDVLIRFFEIWTGKEAYFKAEGTGITDFQTINVLKLERQVVLLEHHLVQIIEKRS